jgi:AraC-like DNA-binding protein
MYFGRQIVFRSPMDRRIAWALDQMQRRLNEPLSLATVASEINLSVSRFAHLFQHDVGASPAQYLHALRMIRARLLIERTFLTVKEVMNLVGCNDASHFARDFRRFHGLSPTECRAAAATRPLQGLGA